ncbi:potassium channel family protein [Planctomycetota bacterium]|nr:potassium channel family protein [Planctomycetota bacterium]
MYPRLEKIRPIAARMLLVSCISALFIFPFAASSFAYTLASLVCFLFMIASGVLLARRRREAVGLVVMGMVLIISQFLRVGLDHEFQYFTETVGRLVGLAFSIQLAAVSIRHVVLDSSYTWDRYFGAATGYFMLGLAFADIYLLISFLVPSSFEYGGTGPLEWVDAMYFSLVTLTTLGYGDVRPVGEVARMVAALEAVFGVLYLAMLVSMFMSEFRVLKLGVRRETRAIRKKELEARSKRKGETARKENDFPLE